MKRIILSLILVAFCGACDIGRLANSKVQEVKGKLPELPAIDVVNPDRFLNDLMLSPLWKVEKDRDGSLVARARAIGNQWPSREDGSFLFEFMSDQNRKLPDDFHVNNLYLEGNKVFSSFQITVVFTRPSGSDIVFGELGQDFTIPVYETFGSEISANSTSRLAIRLSKKSPVYVILRENGSDPTRKTTFDKLLPTMQELTDLANAPETYRIDEQYSDFFEMFFAAPLKDEEIKRNPGTQGRDTFYGYLRAKPDTSYKGVNIKISHPEYCPNEGTRESSRLRKAEHLGKPYLDGDVVFFMIEDNAVYLPREYDDRFGIFTGKESFEGDLELLNDREQVLLKTKDMFKGWQR